MEPMSQLPINGPTSVSQRRAQMDAASVPQVRALATQTYKKPDGVNYLMTFAESLGDRVAMKQLILDYELAHGMIYQDGQEPAQLSIPVTQPQTIQEVPQVTTPANIPVIATAEVSVSTPEVAGEPRKSRRRANALKDGTSIAPPPPALTAAVQMDIPQASVSIPVVEQAVVAIPTIPSAPTIPSVPSIPQVQVTQVASSPTMGSADNTGSVVSGVLAVLVPKIDMLGKGLEVTASNGHEALVAIGNLRAELAVEKERNKQMFVALQHLYKNFLTGPNFKISDNPAEFSKFLSQFTGPLQ